MKEKALCVIVGEQLQRISDKNAGGKMNEESLAHTKKDHIVFISKYRRKVMYGECMREINDMIKHLLG